MSFLIDFGMVYWTWKLSHFTSPYIGAVDLCLLILVLSFLSSKGSVDHVVTNYFEDSEYDYIIGLLRPYRSLNFRWKELYWRINSKFRKFENLKIVIEKKWYCTVAERGQSKLKFYYRNLNFLIQIKVLLSKSKYTYPN